jgi:hypothetical protein
MAKRGAAGSAVLALPMSLVAPAAADEVPILHPGLASEEACHAAYPDAERLWYERTDDRPHCYEGTVEPNWRDTSFIVGDNRHGAISGQLTRTYDRVSWTGLQQFVWTWGDFPEWADDEYAPWVLTASPRELTGDQWTSCALRDREIRTHVCGSVFRDFDPSTHRHWDYG